ncbi:MAG: Ig-like domain-containing protein [Verrucomicrobiae bacterium]|nr:Ig-like domain-containing protein [Verrucomicrobiae bacterium]
MAATGSGALTYDWYHLGELDYSNAGPALKIKSVELKDGGPYFVRVHSAYGEVASHTAQLEVTPLHPPPVAHPQAVSVGLNSSLNITLTGSDNDGKSLAYDIRFRPIHGTLTGSPPDVTYARATNYSGADFFVFVVRNDKESSGFGVINILPLGHGPYAYPLTPGTPEWVNVDGFQRLISVNVPQAWIDHATSWDLFRSAVNSPYFHTLWIPGYGGVNKCYEIYRQCPENSHLRKVDTAPDFGSNVLRYLEEMQLGSVEANDGSDFSSPSLLDYIMAYQLAGLDSALNTMDQASIQKLFRLAVWDANCQDTPAGAGMQAAPVRLLCVIYGKPERLRGSFPAGVKLPALTPAQQGQLEDDSMPEGIMSSIAAVKSALGIKSRPQVSTASQAAQP